MLEVKKMSEPQKIIKNRAEILFLYDVKDANPNGDPADENKPRIDEETGVNIVTDVRIKRTIRDYLHDFKEQEIFVKEIVNEEGKIQDAKARARDFLEGAEGTLKEQMDKIKSNILSKCIDVRLFGATIPIELSVKKKKKGADSATEDEESAEKTSSITLIGPVQFKMARSLHEVELKYIKGTGAFASKAGKEQKTFREEWIVPYSLICVYGIINENAAKETNLTEDDVQLLLDGLWNGTKNLISRSKVGQVPRLLIKVNYNEKNYHIGDLDKLVKIKSTVPDEQLRDISEVELDISELIKTLQNNKEKIASIEYMIDERVKVSPDLRSLGLGLIQLNL